MTEALLTASGIYRDANFVLKKRFGFNVSAAGGLSVRLLPEDLWSRAGGDPYSAAGDNQRIAFYPDPAHRCGYRRVQLRQDRVVIPPGEVVPVMLAMEIGENMTIGSQLITLSFEAEDGMAVVQPEELDIEFAVLTGMEAFRKQFSGLTLGVGIAAGAGLFLILALFVGGSLLNRFYLLPRLMIKGHLLYCDENYDPYTGEGQSGELNLEKERKKEIVISFDAGNPDADFTVLGGDSGYVMIITTAGTITCPGSGGGGGPSLNVH
jgi:hypothetical protein